MDKAKAIELLEQGYNGKVVAAHLDTVPKGMKSVVCADDDLIAARNRGIKVLQDLHAAGMTVPQIAEKFGGSKTGVANAIKGKCYKRRPKPASWNHPVDSEFNRVLRMKW